MAPSRGWLCPGGRGGISTVWRHLRLSLRGGSAAAIPWGEVSLLLSSLQSTGQPPRLRNPAQQERRGVWEEEGGTGGSSFLVCKSRYKPCPAYQIQECSSHCVLAHLHPFPSPLPCLPPPQRPGKQRDSFAARDGHVTPFRPMRQKEKSTQGFWENADFLIKGTKAGHDPLLCPPQTRGHRKW